MGSMKAIKWQLLIMTGLGTVIFMYIAFIVFVMFYSLFMNPGHEQVFYSQFANLTGGPFMFCFAPFTMYIISRWLCERAGSAFYLHGLLYLLAYEVIDLSLVAFTADMSSFVSFAYLLIILSKLSGVMAGAYFASRTIRTYQPGQQGAI